MVEFKDSHWAGRDFSENYLNKADIFIPDRQRMFDLAVEYFLFHFGNREDLSICDLGSGDGAATRAIMNTDRSVSATLVDASKDMLDKARNRFTDIHGIKYIIADFEDILNGKEATGEHDMFISAQAIHHLSMDNKLSLFKTIHSNLKPGGLFINIDAIKPETPELEKFHLSQWERQMAEAAKEKGLAEFDPKDVIAAYKSPESNNQPDTLEDQLNALRNVGFKQASCLFRSHIFAVFSGCR